MKRFFALLLSVCLMATLFAGCSQAAETDDGPVTITIWHDKEDEVAAALQAELDKLAPDIVVKLERKDGLTEALKMVGNDPKAAPDMYFFAHDKLGYMRKWAFWHQSRILWIRPYWMPICL